MENVFAVEKIRKRITSFFALRHELIMCSKKIIFSAHCFKTFNLKILNKYFFMVSVLVKKIILQTVFSQGEKFWKCNVNINKYRVAKNIPKYQVLAFKSKKGCYRYTFGYRVIPDIDCRLRYTIQRDTKMASKSNYFKHILT